jgi:phage shock protein A
MSSLPAPIGHGDLYAELFGASGPYPARRPQNFSFREEQPVDSRSRFQRFVSGWAPWGGAPSYSSPLLRGVASVRDFDERERRLLEALWALKDGFEKLVEAREQLELQYKSAGDERVTDRLDDEARVALEVDDRELARSLAESALAQKKHRLWLKEQIDRISEQIRILDSREVNLKTRLALVHTHNEALKAQRVAAEARAAVGEALIDFPLDVDDGLDLNRLQEEAQEAEARALAMEELVSSALERRDDLASLAQRQEIDAYLAQL